MGRAATMVSSLVLVIGACGKPATTPLDLGPMVGAVTSSTARIWLRTRAESTVVVTALADDGHEASATVSTARAAAYTKTLELEGLRPDTVYRYTISVDGQRVADSTFRTDGPAARTRPVRLVFGACYEPAAEIRPGPTIFQRMAERNPDLVLFAGDFPYSARGTRPQLIHGHEEIRRMAGFRDLTSQRPTYAVWDDHDFGPDDCDGTHRHAEEALAVFQQWWANAGYGTDQARGIFSRARYGDVELFLLDDRFHQRQNWDQPAMLGAAQTRWLYEGLLASTARFKVIVSGIPFSRVKRDGWAGRYHRPERDQLFAFLAASEIPGLILLSGDVHRVDLYRHLLASGRPLWEFTSGTLAKRDLRYAQVGDALVYSRSDPNAFGEIDFLPAGDPKGAVILRDVSGRHGIAYEHVLSEAELGLPATVALPADLELPAELKLPATPAPRNVR